MREEVLRLDRVTCIEQGVTVLNHFSLTIGAGEVMGLIPVNGTGVESLMRILQRNLPIHYGYVYYRGNVVNHWQHSNGQYNRIGYITGKSGLADDLTVTDNVFVLRHGFQKRVLSRGVLNRQWESFLKETDIRILPSARALDLSAYERYMVEIIKCVVADCRLIVLNDVNAVVGDAERGKLSALIGHYTAKGFSFLYISQHYEEIKQMCRYAAFMTDGQMVKVLRTEDLSAVMFDGFPVQNRSVQTPYMAVRHENLYNQMPVINIRDLHTGVIHGLSAAIMSGECVVVQDMDNRILDDLTDVLAGIKTPVRGTVWVANRRLNRKNSRDIAVIAGFAPQTMLFPELSYMDNLCFAMDHRLRRIWRSAEAKRGVREEYAAWLGAETFDKRIDELTAPQKYDLIYARAILQRPLMVVCVQPFIQADVALRLHITSLLDKVRRKGISIIILTVSLADTPAYADRVIQIRDGRVCGEVKR
jgi:ribose transport system ATP-binding protein